MGALMPLVRKPPPKAEVEARNEASLKARGFDQTRLAAMLLEGSEDERWDAARAAGEAPSGVAMLSEAVSRESVPRIREAIFTALARIRTPESAEAVLKYLRSDDSSIRTGALDALRAMPDAVAASIPRLLRDADADVRLLACELVRNQPAADAGRMLAEVLATEPEANVCAAAVEVAAEAGGPELLPLLAACAARFPNDPFLAFAVQVASERIGSQASSHD
jgi:HEAT repeat protein